MLRHFSCYPVKEQQQPTLFIKRFQELSLTVMSSSSQNNTTVTKEDYCIDFGTTGNVIMSKERVEMLCEKMPILGHLWFGHPNMKPKALKCRDDGVKILTISEELRVVVGKDDFVRMVNCILGLQRLPPIGSIRYDEFINTMTTLGGCPSMEAKLRSLQTEPLTGEEDIHCLYQWQVIFGHIFDSTTEMMMKNGYSLASIQKDDQGRPVTTYFRKRN